MAILTVLSGSLVVFGLAFSWYGLRPLAVVPRLLRTPVRSPSELEGRTAVGDGGAAGGVADGTFVACRGTAAEGERTVAAPFSGESCLGFEYEVTEKQFLAGLPWAWITVDDAVAAVPFRLRDDEGGVVVDPDARRYALDVAPAVTTVGARETPTERIAAFLAVREGLAPGPTSAFGRALSRILAPLGIGDRRYAERLVDPGESHLVAGRLDRTGDRPTVAGRVVISDRGPRATAVRRLRSAALPTLFGLLFVAAGIGLLLLG